MRHWKTVRPIAVVAVIGFLATVAPPSPRPAAAAGDTSFVVNLNKPAAVVPNVFSNMTFFNYPHYWTNKKMDRQAPGKLVAQYPWLHEAYLQYATGGCYKKPVRFPGCLTQRDLLVDGRNPLAGYKFDSIHRAVRNVLNQGLKPYFDLGNVPISFSNPVSISGYFRVNVRPPVDYGKYHDYIRALLQSLVTEFGLAEVRTWRWSVINEFENRFSFETADRDWRSTQDAYFKLYDYTVGALEEVLGAPYVKVGAHCMCVIDGMWDERALLDHVTRGPNLYNGGPNTQLDFLSVSLYEHDIGNPGNLSAIDATITHMRDKANQVGLTNLPIGIDEGGVQYGPDNKLLMYSETGLQWQSSWIALLFKRMLDLNVSWYSSLSLSTKALIGGVRPAHVNVIELASRLAGAKRVSSTRSGTPVNPSDQVQSVAAYNAATKTAYVMVFNHQAASTGKTAEPVGVHVQRIQPATGSTVTVKQWVVDQKHGNFWQTWQSIASTCAVPDNGYKWSKYSAEVGLNLLAPYRSCWKNSLGLFTAAAAQQLVSTTDVAPAANTLKLSTTLAHHGVTLYEITNAAAIA